MDTTHLVNNSGLTCSGYYYIFRQQINSALSAVNINTTPTTKLAEQKDYGIKISKPTIDVKTATAQNLIFISGKKTTNDFCRVHVIHKISTGSYSSSPVTISHDLGYIPQAWWFKNTSGSEWRMVALTETSTTETRGIVGAGSGNYSVIIFKDPVLGV
jgi:hypothetical protein